MAARDPMDAWMNRYRALAGRVVIMVCPVLLAIALNKVDLKSEEHGRAVPITMLVVATITLVAGICPFLVCCFSKRFFNGSSDSPHTATMLLAPLSSTCLAALACWIMYLILHSWAFPVIGALIGLCSVIRTVTHFTTAVGEGDAATAVGCEEYDCNRLESPLDFLAGITALLFLGLEGLALEGQSNSTKTIHDRLTKPIGTSFIVCAVAVGLMLLETMPPRTLVRNLTETIDVLTGFAVSLVMFFIMYAVMELRALLVLVAPFLILMMYVFYAAISYDDGKGNISQSRGAANGDAESVVSKSADSGKPASLELTKVTFTGFLAVSIPSISNGSVNISTECFLHLAATAIVSGLIWRLLTHYKSRTTIAAIADIASLCTHLCIAVATIPFAVMARKALS